MISLVLFVFLLGVAHGLLPIPCCNDEAIESKTCCPYFNGSPCGSSSGRGNCMYIAPNTRAQGEIPMNEDVRLRWPSYYFTWVCKCNYPYWGYDCSECGPGLDGPNCDKTFAVIRRDMATLSARDQIDYMTKLHYIKYKKSERYCILESGDRQRKEGYKFSVASVYDTICFDHHFANKAIFMNNQAYSGNFAHNGVGFCTWHRGHLLQLEREIQYHTRDPTFALHYFNAIRASNCDICHENLLGESDVFGMIDENSVVSHWRAICSGPDYNEEICLNSKCECERAKLRRRPGYRTGSALPNIGSLYACTNLTNAGEFVQCLEMLHGVVHNYFAGDMSKLASACTDPMFYAFHSLVDYWCELGIRRNILTVAKYPSTQTTGHSLHDMLVPIFPPMTHGMMLTRCSNIGYNYDQLA
ncbi:tyrosinase-like [Discoglossus pictus]